MNNKKRESTTQEKRFLSAQDVAEILGVSQSTAYRIIRRLNDDLARDGKIIIPGKISTRYFNENIYM